MEDLKQKNENLGRDAELAIKALLALECMTELQLLLKTKFEEMEDELQNLGHLGPVSGQTSAIMNGGCMQSFDLVALKLRPCIGNKPKD